MNEKKLKHNVGRKKGWSERGENGGRKATGLKRVCFQVSCQPEELEQIEKLVKESGKTKSKFIVDKIFDRA